MSAHETTRRGAPVWIDLYSSDPAAAIDFYSALFGWVAPRPDPDDYTMMFLSDSVVAGIVSNSTGDSSLDRWMTYLRIDDPIAFDAHARAAGATGLRTIPIDELGTSVFLVDPTGAEIAGWAPGAHRGFAVVREHGAPAWHELHTNDFASAVAFYSEAFGWHPSVLADSDEFRMSTLGEGDDAVAGIYDASRSIASGGGSSAVPHWMVYFAVADADAAAATVRDAGGSMLDDPVDTGFGRIAHAADPTGAQFTIIQS